MKKKQKPQVNRSRQKSQLAKSCYSNLGEDPIQSSNLQDSKVVKAPRSFKGFNDDNDQEQKLNSDQKQAIAKNLGVKKNYNNKVPQNFGKEIYLSQYASQLDEQHSKKSSEQNILHKMNNFGQKNKKSYFNLMLIGAASTGKTTYKQCLLKQYKHKNQQKHIKQHTQQITQTKSPPMSSNLSLQFYVIDTPGFTHSSIDSYSKLIQKQINTRVKRTNINKQKALTESSVYQKQQRQVRDQRIHCCLFFFRGPRMHSDDWRILEQLYDKCNIVPVIAKGDSYSIQEILELKKNIKEKAKQKKILWFNIEQYMRQKHEGQLNNITKGPYGFSPPFMIASSTVKIQKDSQIKIGRQFKWGTCVIEDQHHTQFNLLNRLLTTYLVQGFVKMTDVIQSHSQKTEVIVKKSYKQSVHKILVAASAFSIIGLLAYKFGRGQLSNKIK